MEIAVAPFTGAWIEIPILSADRGLRRSHPSRVRGLKYYRMQLQGRRHLVAPFTGAWIEIRGTMRRTSCNTVAPFTGAWIEIRRIDRRDAPGSSHPSRVRGLKYPRGGRMTANTPVAPFTGAWIEIRNRAEPNRHGRVAPFTGAWIEIRNRAEPNRHGRVAPFTGAWIEIGAVTIR